MANIDRGLSEAFVEAFNLEYEKREWIRKLVDDEEIFTAIRNEYINFYYCGCSLLKLEMKNDEFVGKVRYKYLLKPSLTEQKYKYIEVNDDGKIKNPKGISHLFLQDFSDIGALKRAIKPHTECEKVHVHNIIKNNWNAVDIEISLNRHSRIDIAAIQDNDTFAEVVFFEVKLFENSRSLRSRKCTPKIFKQMEGYTDLIRRQHQTLQTNYLRVCQNLISLDGVVPDEGHRSLLKSIADGTMKLSVSHEPVLIVTDFDFDQKYGPSWQPHRKRLRDRFEARFEEWESSNNKKFRTY